MFTLDDAIPCPGASGERCGTRMAAFGVLEAFLAVIRYRVATITA